MGPRPQCYIPSHKVIGPLVLEKKVFEGFLPYMGVAAILVMWPGPREQTFIPPPHWGSIWNLASIGPAVLEKKIFENGGRWTDGRRRTDDRPWLYYKLTNEPKGSGELKTKVSWTDTQTDGQHKNSIPHHKHSLQGGYKKKVLLVVLISEKFCSNDGTMTCQIQFYSR